MNTLNALLALGLLCMNGCGVMYSPNTVPIALLGAPKDAVVWVDGQPTHKNSQGTYDVRAKTRYPVAIVVTKEGYTNGSCEIPKEFDVGILWTDVWHTLLIPPMGFGILIDAASGSFYKIGEERRICSISLEPRVVATP